MFNSKKIKALAVLANLIFGALSSSTAFTADPTAVSSSLPSEKSSFIMDNAGTLKSYKGNSSMVTLPEGIKKIAFGAFKNKKEIEEITLPESLETIDDYAFYSCTSLKSIAIPKNVRSIGCLAFGKCENCKDIEIGEGLEAVKKFAFWECKNLKNITVKAENPNFSSYQGMLYNKDFSDLKICPAAIQKEVTLHENTKSISSYAFQGCENLERLSKNGDKTISIYDAAFQDCKNLKYIDFEDKIDFIGPGAFTNCTSLKKFTIGEKVKFIGSSVFMGCNSLENIIVKAKGDLKIGHKIFESCSHVISVLADKNSPLAKYVKKHSNKLILNIKTTLF